MWTCILLLVLFHACAQIQTVTSQDGSSAEANETNFEPQSDISQNFRFPDWPRPRHRPRPRPPSKDCVTKCQGTDGGTCINAVCCSNLTCVQGNCVQPGCGVLGSPCVFASNQCCKGFNLDCLINPVNPVGFFCQQCLPIGQPCDVTVPPGVIGSCCTGLRCLSALCLPNVTG